MATISLKEFSKAWWTEIYNRVIGAAVFLDDASAESLHWEGGVLNLFSEGAVAVRNLSPFEFSEHKKGVFITQATPTQLHTISNILRHSHFVHIILISCVSFDAVYLELNEGRDVSDVIAARKGYGEARKKLERMLHEWNPIKQNVIEVVHVPIFTISLTNNVFVTPPYQKVYPWFEGNLTPDTASVDLYNLTNEERAVVRRFASALNSLFDSMNMREDIYFMGAYSSLVAGVLENSPVSLSRRKHCLHTASLIMVDRTLDLCGVTSHAMESVLDKIMAVLPRFPGHSNEVAVDMTSLAEAKHHPDESHISPGCLYHADDDLCIQTYDNMINKSQKEVLIDLYNKLSKVDDEKSSSPKHLLKVTPQSLEKIVNAIKGDYDTILKHLGVVQQALGVVQMLKSPLRSRMELLMNLENQVLQNLATSRDSTSVLHQISQLIKTRKDRNIPLQMLLALIVHVYSLIGTEVSFSKQHEDSLRETLSVAIFEDHTDLFLDIDTHNAVTPQEADEISNKVMIRLKEIAQMRKSLQKYNSVLKPCEAGGGHEYRGLLQQLVDDLVDAERPEIPDLTHSGGGAAVLRELLRTGFGILSNKKPRSPKHPLDNQTVIIFVIGGMSAEECKRLHRSVITSGVDNTVVFASTKLVTPIEAMMDVLI